LLAIGDSAGDADVRTNQTAVTELARAPRSVVQPAEMEPEEEEEEAAVYSA